MRAVHPSGESTLVDYKGGRRTTPSEALARIAQLASKVTSANAASASRITTRQQEVLRLLATGHSNKEIAKVLGLSPATIKTHVAQVMANIGANNRAEAAARAVGLGLV